MGKIHKMLPIKELCSHAGGNGVPFWQIVRLLAPFILSLGF
jgi:hypothetical protein